MLGPSCGSAGAMSSPLSCAAVLRWRDAVPRFAPGRMLETRAHEASCPGPTAEPGLGIQWSAPEPWLGTTPLCSLLSFSRVWKDTAPEIMSTETLSHERMVRTGHCARCRACSRFRRDGLLPRGFQCLWGTREQSDNDSRTVTLLCAGVSVGPWESMVRSSRAPAGRWQLTRPPQPPGALPVDWGSSFPAKAAFACAFPGGQQPCGRARPHHTAAP